MDKTSLGNRIKKYENVTDIRLMCRAPVIVRVDGKGFSRWAKKMKLDRPFDVDFSTAMQYAMTQTAQSIEGCVFGYTQSDEITFILRNNQSLESEPWFANRVQKIVSIVASLTTVHFNRSTQMHLKDFSCQFPIAVFDARVFTVPSLNETINVLVWRQNDATKNSISTTTYHEVSKVLGKGTTRKRMHGLNSNQQQELLFQEANVNWNDLPVWCKRGIVCYKEPYCIEGNDGETYERKKWVIDAETPVFTQNREWLISKLQEKDKNSE